MRVIPIFQHQVIIVRIRLGPLYRPYIMTLVHIITLENIAPHRMKIGKPGVYVRRSWAVILASIGYVHGHVYIVWYVADDLNLFRGSAHNTSHTGRVKTGD